MPAKQENVACHLAIGRPLFWALNLFLVYLLELEYLEVIKKFIQIVTCISTCLIPISIFCA